MSNGSNGRTLSGIPKAMLRLLADGKPHTKDELMSRCMENELSETLPCHIFKVRSYLRPFGFEVVCNTKAGTWQITRTTPELSRRMLSQIEAYELPRT